MQGIKFGTDGWRGIMADDFTFENVQLVSQSIADYVWEVNLAEKGIVIGYDNRFLAEQFAQKVAVVLCGNGIKTYLAAKAIPTPVTAFAVKHLGTAGAVMLTASHNPPEYNGIKFIPDYAGPALPYVTNKLEENIKRVLAENRHKDMDYQKAVEMKMLETFDPTEAYMAHLKEVIRFDAISQAALKIIIDPMYGAGIGYLDRLLKDAGCWTETIHGTRDPLFGGRLPEPTGASLHALSELVLEEGADLGLALDGDADRFGVIDREGNYITPNQVLSLVYYHLINNRALKGPAARSVATTHMLDKIAAHYGYQVEETPVGFKYIGESMMKRGSVIGGEESGGLSIAGHIPEKDGILAALLVAEMVAVEKKSIPELLQKLGEKFGTFISERIDIHTSIDKKQMILQALNGLDPEIIADEKVVSTTGIDGKKFVLEDGSWVLIRASGTEPLFRVYVEAEHIDRVRAIQKDIKSLLKL